MPAPLGGMGVTPAQGLEATGPQLPAGLTTTASSPTQLGAFTSLPVAVDEPLPANVQTVVPGVLSVDVAVPAPKAVAIAVLSVAVAVAVLSIPVADEVAEPSVVAVD